MKRILIFSLIFSLFCGCAPFGTDKYVVVEPHDEGYEVAIDSNAVTVSSYLGLKNAITDMVEECVTDGVIRAEGYSGDVTEDIANAVYEIWRGDPLGAFAVDYMTYDCSKIVSYYEIHIHATYRRTAEEIASLAYASNAEGLKEKVREAMSTYEPVLRVRVSDYEELDYEELVLEVFRENPEFALELPNTAVTTYPESGAQRIVEILFTYETPRESLIEMHTKAKESLDYIIKLYGSNNDEMVSARRFYNRVTRDGVLRGDVQPGVGTLDSVYDVLIGNAATSYGYAQTYYLMLRAKDIPCVVLHVNYLGQSHYLCQVILEEETYYIDPARALMELDEEFFLLYESDLSRYGYEILD